MRRWHTVALLRRLHLSDPAGIVGGVGSLLAHGGQFVDSNYTNHVYSWALPSDQSTTEYDYELKVDLRIQHGLHFRSSEVIKLDTRSAWSCFFPRDFELIFDLQ